MLLHQNSTKIFLIFVFQLLTLNFLILKPSQAESRDFKCQENVQHPKTNKSYPATMVENTTGNVIPFIYWVEEVAGETAIQRCQDVSKKIQVTLDNKFWSEAFLRTGHFGDYPVICFVPDYEDRECKEDEIIITLKKGEDAKKILSKILGNKIGLELSGNVSFTEGKKHPSFYVDVNRLLEKLEEQTSE